MNETMRRLFMTAVDEKVTSSSSRLMILGSVVMYTKKIVIKGKQLIIDM